MHKTTGTPGIWLCQ